MNRRQFMASGGSAALAFTVMKSGTAMGTAANSKVRLGLIGCGGRGTWICDLFARHGGYEIVAGADYFADKVNEFGDKFKIDPARRFTGLSAYKRLLEKGEVDAVAIESPPYFHPEQAQAAVDAGKHTYIAKPIAVDVPGCKTIEESGKKATARKLVYLIDFQTRTDPFYQEALKRVHAGALGKIAFGEATYHAECPWTWQIDVLKNEPNNPEVRLRAWGLDFVLSGDIITEQNIHTLDVMNWVMQTPPLFAVGTGGHTARQDTGTCWDHYACLFQYPNQVGMTFSSRQYAAWGTQPEGIRNRVFGSKGVLETEYGGQVIIRAGASDFYRGGKTSQIYEAGAIANIATFHKSILESNYANPTIAPSVQSNLITLLGRIAAHEKRQVTWEELLKNNQKLEFSSTGLKD